MNWNILMDSLSIITLSCYENIVKCSSTDIKNIYMFYSVSNSVLRAGPQMEQLVHVNRIKMRGKHGRRLCLQ